MDFTLPIHEVRLIKRYKRFLADVENADGSVTTVHCPNPGSMLGLTNSGNRAWISDSCNSKRKLRYTLEMVEADGVMVGINTNHPNHLAREAIETGMLPNLSKFSRLRTEVKYGKNSRIDILLENEATPPVYVEVKNVHFVRAEGLFEFPDSVTTRGAKHLDEMAKQVRLGNRAAMLYIIQRGDGDRLGFANDLDPGYVEALRRAISQGVETYALKCKIMPSGIVANEIVEIIKPE